MRAVLADPAYREAAYREAAETMRAEIDALPGPEHAVTLLERLGVEKQPIFGNAPAENPR